ncbi:Peptidoglycan/LPS O-acetylase OafA/YrhL, contains acyltransferase and SGNH-hydrolase domains [Actinokineospora diospyrosa]|uniref:Peptidoglycan/LPS O-acetylase OafA/YrhL, contains acyltransferase and SGNH-hydrolase domains n=1 Tax=Actinokineospora diospyrosa TaxID=103728 RepID=A0ABT1IEE3_9PSEU|nr:Peptidoglycan/LPS O-acetylase OafA/YrhL, contains acyltransferase and SGNH-hydrolase domains [Actinokineospora diospyrosa]
MVAPAAGGSAAPSTEKQRVPRLEGIRGICALGVVITHTAFISGLVGSYDSPPTNMFAAALMSGFTVSLSPFFVLSGLLLYRPFARASLSGKPGPALGKFFTRRVFRLLPAYYLLTLVCLFVLNANSVDSVWYVLRPLVLMQNYDAVWMAGMDPTWSVPTEMQFYLVLPLLAWLMGKLGRTGATMDQRVRRMMIVPAVMLVLNFPWIIYLHWGHLGPYPKEYFWPFAQLGVFAIGMAMAVISARAQLEPDRVPALHRVVAAHPNAFWLAAAALFVVNCFSPFARIGYFDFPYSAAAVVQLTTFLLWGPAVVLPLSVPGAASKFQDAVLTNLPVRYLGRVSYGIYLWHFAVIYFWFQNGSIFGNDPVGVTAFRGRNSFLELITVVVLACVVMATISYFLVERPLQRLSDRITRPPAPTPAAGADPVATVVVPNPVTATPASQRE